MTEPDIGIYEKALPGNLGWDVRLGVAAEAGYRFVELSIDDDPVRLARLEWTPSQRRNILRCTDKAGVPVNAIVLSAHRRYPLGSSSPETRKQANRILERAICLAGDIGAPIVQIAGYFVYYEAHDAGSRAWFLEGLSKGCDIAASAGIVLGLETMDGEDVTSVVDAVAIADSIESESLKIYPDVGNLSANGHDVVEELRACRGRIACIHLKDTRPGEFRRVQFGEGSVPFVDAFQVIDEIGYTGNYLVEMWNDDHEDARAMIANARDWILERMAQAGLLETHGRSSNA